MDDSGYLHVVELWKNFKGLLILFHVYECFACVYVHVPRAWLALLEGIRSPGTEVIVGCELTT